MGKLFNKLLESIAKENGYLYRLTGIQSLRVNNCFDINLIQIQITGISP